MDLFCGAGLSYSVKVKEKATIAFVAQEALDAAIAADPSVYRYILHSITRKYRIILLQLTNHTFNNAAGMVADALIRLAACSGHPESDQSEGIISTAFTQDELAHNVGCSRITVSRILKKFQQENLISIKNKKILIHDTISLADYTDQFL